MSNYCMSLRILEDFNFQKKRKKKRVQIHTIRIQIVKNSKQKDPADGITSQANKGMKPYVHKEQKHIRD